MEALGPWHLLLILIGFVLLFGYRKLPDATRSVGRSLRIFRSELRGMADDDHATPSPAEPPSPVEPPAPVEPPSVAELEREAAAAEALAVRLRAAARTDTGASSPDSGRPA